MCKITSLLFWQTEMRAYVAIANSISRMARSGPYTYSAMCQCGGVLKCVFESCAKIFANYIYIYLYIYSQSRRLSRFARSHHSRYLCSRLIRGVCESVGAWLVLYAVYVLYFAFSQNICIAAKYKQNSTRSQCKREKCAIFRLCSFCTPRKRGRARDERTAEHRKSQYKFNFVIEQINSKRNLQAETVFCLDKYTKLYICLVMFQEYVILIDFQVIAAALIQKKKCECTSRVCFVVFNLVCVQFGFVVAKQRQS